MCHKCNGTGLVMETTERCDCGLKEFLNTEMKFVKKDGNILNRMTITIGALIELYARDCGYVKKLSEEELRKVGYQIRTGFSEQFNEKFGENFSDAIVQFLIDFEKEREHVGNNNG